MRSVLPAAVLTLLVLAGSPGWAGVDLAKVNDSTKATEVFASLAKGSETTGIMPRQTDPAVKAVLDRIFDLSAFGSETLSMADLGKGTPMLMNGTQVLFTYLLAGTGQSDPAKLTDPQAAARAERNVGEYAPEIARYYDFAVRTQHITAASVLAYLASASKQDLERPNVKSGLANVQGGIAQTLEGVLDTIAGEGVSDAWRRERLAVLNEVAPRVVKVLLPEHASALRDQALQHASSLRDTEVQRALRTFAENMAR